jgi:hypothetical protein
MDNQVQELDYILPDDYVEEEVTQPDEEENEETIEEVTEGNEETEEVEETAEETTETVEDTEPVKELLEELEIKFLHDTKKLKDFNKDEIKTLVQKGMNHDRLNEKLTDVNTKLGSFQEIAELYGYDVETLSNALLNQYFDTKAEQEGTTPDLVKREHNLNKREKGRQAEAKQKDAFEKFVDTYPNVKNEDITPLTWERVKNGLDLTTAYEMQLKDNQLEELKSTISKLQNEVKTVKQNADIKKKAVVKSTTKNGSDEVGKDDFLEGLLG